MSETGATDGAVAQIQTRCPRCHEKYSGPRILPCLHTLCLSCLHTLEPLSTLGVAGKHEVPQKSVLCPVCDAEVALPPGGVEELLPDLLAEGEVLLERLRSGGQEVPCDLCGDGKAERRCQDCSVNMCGFCCQAHRRQKRTTGHPVIRLQDLPPGSSLSPAPCCTLHPSEGLCLFCEPCALPSCRDCALTKHHGHTLHPAPEAAGRDRERLRWALREAKPWLGLLDTTLHGVRGAGEALRRRAEALRGEVETFTEGYVRAVREHRTRLLRDLDEEVKRRERALSLRGARLQQRLSDLHTATGFTEGLLGRGTDLHLLRAQGLALSRLRELSLGDPGTAELEEATEIRFKPREEVGLCRGYQMYGAVRVGGAEPEWSEVRVQGLRCVQQGQPCSFTLTCKDSAGEPLGHGGERPRVTITYKESESSLPPTVQDNHDGTYHISCIPAEAGDLTIGVCIKGRHVQGSPFTVTVTSRQHPGVFHCCTFCSSGGQKDARCGCGGTMPGGYHGCGHGHKGHPGCSHWSCCGCTTEKSECGGVKDTAQRSVVRTVAL